MRSGIVHRDLKPANVMVGGDGRVKVLDFGLARMRGAEGEFTSSQLPTDLHTREGAVMGTAPYMSPEQVSGLEVDHRTDIFSLGVVLYEMATGTRPFQGPNAAALLSAILRDSAPAVTDVRPDLPRELDWLISRCLEKDRKLRTQSASEVRDELAALRRQSSSGAHPRSALAATPIGPWTYSSGQSTGVSTRTHSWRSIVRSWRRCDSHPGSRQSSRRRKSGRIRSARARRRLSRRRGSESRADQSPRVYRLFPRVPQGGRGLHGSGGLAACCMDI
jgi:serine/threonine protein kinase